MPNITPTGPGHWGDDDCAWSDDGQNPSGDYAGGDMAEVIRNTSLSSAEDRAAIANHIYTLPPRQGPPRPPKRQ